MPIVESTLQKESVTGLVGDAVLLTLFKIFMHRSCTILAFVLSRGSPSAWAPSASIAAFKRGEAW